MNSLNATISLDSSSSEDLDDLCIDHELVDLDDIAMAPQKPHFLDYDAIPPPGFEESIVIQSKVFPSTSMAGSGENVKLDKKYERDGEISDYELAASGVTKKEVNSQRKLSDGNLSSQRSTGARKKKHFLDENPIPPDYMLEKEKEREHRSLDRNFERQNDFESLGYDRKHSLDRDLRPRKVKEPSYTLSRFIEGEISPACHSTWPVDRPSDNGVGYSSMPFETIGSLAPKVDCVYSIFSMLGSHDSNEMSRKFLELSRAPDTCSTLRRSGCIPLLVQMMHSDPDEPVRRRAATALHNVVHCHPDDKAGRREAKVLRLIEQVMDYCNFLKTLLMSGGEAIADDADRHPLPAISSLMKVSFDEEHRQAMCQLGALQAIASLVHLDHAVHGPKPEDQCCNSLRRLALMALTNLTFGDGNNKALLCANKEFMEALVAQLESAPDDLLQVTASVLRNLSWRADNNMKAILNEIGTVTALTKAAMKNKNENTLKAILSALWNLSAHCSTNKAEFCSVEGALAFLVDMLTYEGPSKTLKIIENAGGILRNVSSHIAVREDYRKILRHRNCLGILLQQLKSESLTVVSNACGTLWNLSARFPEDQKYLWDNGAVPMLRSLIHSKHKMISEGSSAALKNLLNFRPGALNQNNLDPIAKSMGLKELPTLNARKQKALEQELNQNLAETCDNLDVITPPKEKPDYDIESSVVPVEKHPSATRLTRSAIVSKSESRDSIVSAKSDSAYENFRRGHSAPPGNNATSKEEKPPNMFAIRNNFVESGYDIEHEAEQPIDYSAKYNIESAAAQKRNLPTSGQVKPQRKGETRNYAAYQETDLDQLTDFSLRYAENQVESDTEEKVAPTPGSEIILILEDTVKCYQTEGTPYAISNAASVSDLQIVKPEPEPRVRIKHVPQKPEVIPPVFGSGTYTPEKPINYCEEGTPGYFSRYESLSSLDESPPNCVPVTKVKPEIVEEETFPESMTEKIITKIEVPKIEAEPTVDSEVEKKRILPLVVSSSQLTTASKSATTANSAQETPLMFSRRSSMDSLASAEPNTADDKSSVVSDFSRLASGIISPSELPDSPTQSMPQSPRRSSSNVPSAFANASASSTTGTRIAGQPRLRSVFEDDLNTFRVENTPAQFSCATSLSNLSLDDEPKISGDCLAKEIELAEQNARIEISKEAMTTRITENGKSARKADDNCLISDGEDTGNDDMILANCINIGMNRGTSVTKLNHSTPNKAQSEKVDELPVTKSVKDIHPSEDIVKQYYTEDTPALLSKVGSNSNLSALSLYTNKCDTANLSDESSNASDGGHELLEQCIRDGMQKTSSTKQKIPPTSTVILPSTGDTNNIPDPVDLPQRTTGKDPIAMLRRGGLPPYLPVKDEMNKFNVEDSPCNFSVISALSNLTIGSGAAGPANMKSRSIVQEAKSKSPEKALVEQKQIAEDSLSSISVESEDDTNLLSQAIAAGCNKGKLKSQPAHSNVNTESVTRQYHGSNNGPNQMYPMSSGIIIPHDANDSLSSIDSSDSNDNHAKSLLEQCIRTGMIKDKKPDKPAPLKVIMSPKRSHLPTPNMAANSIGIGMAIASNGASSSSRLAERTTRPIEPRDRQKDRERKDEQLLMECINTGISKNVRLTDTQIKPPSRHVRQVLGPADFSQRFIPVGMQSDIPKNGETTSVAVAELHRQRQPHPQAQSLSQAEVFTPQSAPNTAPDVETREAPDGTNTESKSHRTPQDTISLLNRIGSESNAMATVTTTVLRTEFLDKSYDSLNLSSEGNGPLDESNEYPALKVSNIDFTNSANESSFEMDVSNEFLIENELNEPTDNSASHKIDKHKDPDLMLKSVERLTHQLVSTAEFLRTAGPSSERDTNSNEFNSNQTAYEKKSSSNSNSNNTWNEDTCPNDVSFPSISITAPMITSLNDDETTVSDLHPSVDVFNAHSVDANAVEMVEKTPTNENRNFIEDLERLDDFRISCLPDSQPNSLETETDTLVNDDTDGSCSGSGAGIGVNNNGEHRNESSYSTGIQFKVGGEVQQLLNSNLNRYISSGPMSFEPATVMTNSAMIALEANQLANRLMQAMTDSTNSLDLDNIRPPSGMECISMTGCYDVPQSPQLSRLRKKSLPAGLMARRALGGGQNVLGGSVESVNSSCNLDNVKPPSLMDELLDSMISVASITSEIVDTTSVGSKSNYETAFSDVDENTTTLQSCMDGFMPCDYDSNSGTPIPSDFSSAESTPRKNKSAGNCTTNGGGGVKRNLTPKQRRKLTKDRYRTYTIAADFVLKENFVDDEQNGVVNGYHEEDELLKVEIDYQSPVGDPSTPEQLNYQRQWSSGGSDESVSHKRDKVSSTSKNFRRSLDPDRFKTRTIVYDATLHNTTQSVNDEPQSTTENDDDADDLTSIRALTKQFKYINDPEVGSTTNDKDLHPVSPNSQLRDDIRTTTESDYNSMEYEQNSETESCDQNVQEEEEGDEEEEVQEKLPCRPRILKPHDRPISAGEDDSGDDPYDGSTEVIKVVRGRKKPAYVSPYKKATVMNGNVRTTSPKPQINGNVFRANLASKMSNPELKKGISVKQVSRNQTIVTKTHVFLNNASLTNKINATKLGLAKPGFLSGAVVKKTAIVEKYQLNKKGSVDKASSGSACKKDAKVMAEVPQASLTAPVSVLERQGTFVKDEPSNAEVPIVTSLPPSPAKSSKLPTKTIKSAVTTPNSPGKTLSAIASRLRTPLQKSASMDASNKVHPKSILPSTRQLGFSASNDVGKRKNSFGIRKSPSVPAVPQRSNSNASIRTTPLSSVGRQDLPATNPPSRSNSNLSAPRLNVTSRIAGIWKKADEPKKPPATPKPPQRQTSVPGKLIRSSTFDNTPGSSGTGTAATGANSAQSSPPGNAGSTASGVSRLRPPKASSAIVRPKAIAGISSTTASESGVVRRTKNPNSAQDGNAKRTSRLGTFINVENECQVAG